MVCDCLTVNRNGHRLIDNVSLSGVPESGPIGLQHHGGLEKDVAWNKASSPVRFRNPFIKPL